jgi:Flp pilus assembly protein TadG
MRNSGICNLLSVCGDWFSDRRGNVAITFAIAIIPVFGAMGVAVDYSMANSARTNMQASLDATGIALQRQSPLTQNQMDTIGGAFFFGNLGYSPLSDIAVSFTPGTGTITLAATGTYHTGLASVLKLIGMPTSFPVTARSQVQWGIGKVEVALALDNTGSMSTNGKLTQLKAAAKLLLNVLQTGAATPGDAKVAIIPFATEVNLGTTYVNESWIRWDLWDAANQNCSGGWGGGGWGGGGGGSCTPKPHNQWTGCVTDRDQSNDVSDTTPTTANATKFPAQQCETAIATVMPLNYNWTALNAKVDQMIASGNTNVPIGLAWGFHALSPTTPLTEGVAYGTANLTKYLIILTDGDNTQNRWQNTDGGQPTNAETAAIDARAALTCTNIKAAGIKIYAIRVINGNDTLLRNCASEPSMYYDVQDAGQLSGVFNSIAAVIANLHLSK